MSLNNKGLTLIELLISIILVSIVLTFLFQLLVLLNDETDNNDFAYNNQINRLEVIKTIQNDLLQNELIGVEDVTNGDNIKINFYFNEDKITSLESNETDNKHYLIYTDTNGVETKWLMKNATIDSCGNFTYYIDSSNYHFHLNIYIYNSDNNEKNNQNNNNPIDDIEISYTGNSSNLNLETGYLTNSESGYKQIGNCTQ